MSTPKDQPKPDDSAANDDGTIVNRPAAKLDDLYPTLANNAPEGKKTDRPALYSFLELPVEADELGRLAHFRILDMLGSGGMGIVFLAEDSKLGRKVALKVMKAREDDDALSAGLRFLKEARALAMIKHDHLVTIYDVGQAGATYYYAMELLAGETLESQIKRVKRWKTTEIMRIGVELASGLAAIHEHGLIHRDIKPTNVWLEARGAGSKKDLPPRVKILDFGLVRDVKDDAALTETGIILGTPAFMSPEQVRGKKVDGRTDLYSLGCILYRLCTGRYPHDGGNSMAHLAAIVADEPESVSALNPEIPPALARLVMQLLSKGPDDRPRSAVIVADRLRQLLQNRTVPDGDARMESDQIHDIETADLRVKPSFWSRHWIKMSIGGVAGLSVLGFCVLAGLLAVFLVVFREFDKKGPPPPPPPPKEGKLFLTDMKPVQAVSWPFVGKKDKDKKDKKPPKDKDFDRVVVNGEPSPHGIFMHAAMPFDPPASLSYQLDGRFSEFTARASINDTSFGAKEGMIFAAYGDGKELWKSRPVLTKADAQDVAVSVKGVNILKLEVTVPGDIGGAHGVWIEPLLKR